MGLPHHQTSSKQGRELPMRGAVYEARAIFQVGLGLEALGFGQLPF